MSDLSGHYCGQVQPHAAHTWTTPPDYGHATVIGTYQCAGVTAEVAPGLCWQSPEGMPNVRCELLAGHVGAHECARNVLGGGTSHWLEATS